MDLEQVLSKYVSGTKLTELVTLLGNEPSTTLKGILKQYVTRRELAKFLDLEERTIIRWERLGCGPPMTRLGKRPLYHLDSFAKWLRDIEGTRPYHHLQPLELAKQPRGRPPHPVPKSRVGRKA